MKNKINFDQFSIVTKCKIPEGLKTLSEKEDRFIKSLQPNHDVFRQEGKFTNNPIKDVSIIMEEKS